MDIFKAFSKRCSVRKYSGEKISDEILDNIISAALSSPSGRNLWPSELIIVRSRESLSKLSECKQGSAKMLESADCAIAVLGDENRSDTWIEDASIVMSNLHIAAVAAGVGSCWIQVRGRKTADGTDSEKYVRSILGIPQTMRVLAILSMGIPVDETGGRDISRMRKEKLHIEKY